MSIKRGVKSQYFLRVGIASVLAVTIASPGTVYSQDEGAPPWGQFLRQGRWPGFDRLLRRPFRMAPEEEVKGLAAKLRARELDIPNRTRAVKYLKTFHCAKFPEARDMLIDVMLNDKWEPVRYEAAKGLRDMFANCACCPEDEKSKREIKQDRLRGAPDPGSPKHCACCCDADTLTKLAKVAYETTETGCCFEPSRRVREMAVEAIKACGVPCNYEPYMATEEHGPPAFDEIDNGGQGSGGSGGGEFVPPSIDETSIGPASGMPLLTVPSVTKAEPISRLKEICLVSLKTGQKATASPKYASNYRGRVYHFASAESQIRFEANPERYAVAFGGCDPVHFVKHREVLEGRYLVEHDNRFYMFATKENFELFKADTARYTGHQPDRSQLALANPLP